MDGVKLCGIHLVYGTYEQDLRSRWRSTVLCVDLGRKIGTLNGLMAKTYALAMDLSNDFEMKLVELEESWIELNCSELKLDAARSATGRKGL